MSLSYWLFLTAIKWDISIYFNNITSHGGWPLKKWCPAVPNWGLFSHVFLVWKWSAPDQCCCCCWGYHRGIFFEAFALLPLRLSPDPAAPASDPKGSWMKCGTRGRWVHAKARARRDSMISMAIFASTSWDVIMDGISYHDDISQWIC